ncbi:cytochrome c-type biogenesis protein CcmF [Lewinella marina]|uniref:Cytochrome c assembly protein n=1 Tax=Neolewinella marina TaxID=438751 RepID=A0A2G0CHU6_9BACT|nr:cytochrome c biogenesis protein CcsA [Neolewinella marina]NJB85331.1 cytochrome c-type biogenesis protein CcmF [Neolewinella marina]PHK99553.1 cytochrome c assembly protein [Neolewinella marina]
MEEIQYLNEHLGPRYIGHFAILLSFFAAILSMVSYFLATQYRGEVLRSRSWQRLGQLSFLAHGAAVFTVIGCIFYAMLNQYYEYQYVTAHVDGQLQQRYIFSAFWEGQEGSFLLWSFWHVILGYVLMVTARSWEKPVMAVVCSVQVIIVSMLLGVHFGFGDLLVKLGSNPLLLLRETVNAPIFQQADYVELLRGNGLNPSLQNYWMTIHPPTLFLGFASTVVPFAYAVAGLWTGRHKEWLNPGLKWSLFSAGILGIGILMGAAWAYEALNFGGYWAWDPVENTSLVPWLMLVAGIHTNLISRATGQGIRATYLFYLFTFVLIVYSTFLTRSGVLGDTSVHAFTEMGLEAQLLFFLGFYFVLSLGLVIWRWRHIPVPEKEESTSSREFWMFIGSLTLFMSAVLITGSTSLPVYNEIRQAFDPVFDGLTLTDPEAHHNRFQIWIGIFVGLLSGAAQYLRWRERKFSNHFRWFARHTGLALVGAGLLTYLTLLWIEAPTLPYKAMLFAGWFAVWANIDYLFFFVRKDPKIAGSVVSHLGFGIMLIGIMASSGNKRIISQNQFLMEGLTEDEQLARSTVRLYEGIPLGMEDYIVTFTGDTIEGMNRRYFMDYQRMNEAGEVVEEFQLEPNVLYDKGFEKIAITNPSTKHYWNRDVFTVIMGLPPEEQSVTVRQQTEDSLQYRVLPLVRGQQSQFQDTVDIPQRDRSIIYTYTIGLEDFSRHPSHPEYTPEPGDIGMGAKVRAVRTGGIANHDTIADVAIVLREGLLYHYPAQLNDMSLRVKIDESIFDQLLVKDADLEYREFVVEPGSRFRVGDREVTFQRFISQPEVNHFQPQDGDIYVSALLESAGLTMQPVFLIRGNQPSGVRDEITELGLYAHLVSLNPETNEATLRVANAQPKSAPTIPVAVAPRSYRTDYITLQAIEFPGISLFWFGTTSMMIGLLISMVTRLRSRRLAARD